MTHSGNFGAKSGVDTEQVRVEPRSEEVRKLRACAKIGSY